MFNGAETKSHTVTDLEVTDVNEVADTVSGTTSSGFDSVNVSIYDGGPNRNVENVAGNWSADFSVPWEDQGTWDIGPGTNGEANESDADGDSTQRSWGIPNPRFHVGVDEDPQQVWGNEWTPGDLITATVKGVGYPNVATVGSGPEDSGQFGFDLFAATGGVVVVPDDVIVIEDESGNSKTHTVTSVAVTSIDEAGDSVSGIAEVGAWVDVQIHDACGLGIEADSGGNWTVAFTPDSGCEVDIGPGTNGSATEHDDDGDATQIQWGIPNPVIRADQESDELWGHQFGPSSSVNVMVVPFAGGDPIIYPAIPTSGEGDFGFNTMSEPPGYGLEIGDEITVTDTVDTKVLEVTGLRIDTIDADNAIVTGWAPEFSTRVSVWVEGADGVWLGIDEGLDYLPETGFWTADFGATWGTDVIGPGTNIDSSDCDAEDDCTHARAYVPFDPEITVYPVSNGVDGHGFTANSTVTISVDGVERGWLDTDEEGGFGDEIGFDLDIGQRVEVSDGSTTKDHLVVDVGISDVDYAEDVVSGWGPPNQTVHVGTDSFEGELDVLVPGSGDWTVDFSPGVDNHDIQDGEGAYVRTDEYPPEADDGDATRFTWPLPIPELGAWMTRQEVTSWGWMPNTTVDVSIAGTEWTDLDVEYGFLSLDLWDDPFVLVEGLTVQISGIDLEGNPRTITHDTTDLAVTGVDPVTNVVEGTAGVFSDVQATVWGEGDDEEIFTSADGGGFWAVDFDDIGVDFELGITGGAAQHNNNGYTVVDWWVVNPHLSFNLTQQVVSGGDFVEGATVALSVLVKPACADVVVAGPMRNALWKNVEFALDPGT
jgi:hypothetical protein